MNDLELSLLAVNILNEYAKKTILSEKAHFNRFLGRDVDNIFNMDGSVKIRYRIPKLDIKFEKDGCNCTVSSVRWIDSNVLMVHIMVRVNPKRKRYYIYKNETFPICNLNNGILTSNEDNLDRLDKVYDIEKLTEKMKADYNKLAENGLVSELVDVNSRSNKFIS